MSNRDYNVINQTFEVTLRVKGDTPGKKENKIRLIAYNTWEEEGCVPGEVSDYCPNARKALIMLKGTCPKCGKKYTGWALRNPRNQMCSCGTALDIKDDLTVTKGYSPFEAEKYVFNDPGNQSTSYEKEKMEKESPSEKPEPPPTPK